MRIVGFGLNIWDKPAPEIAKDLFSNFKDKRPSFYESSPLEELKTVAAYALTTQPKPFHLVRVTREDLAEVGLAGIDEAPGTTGILSVDFRHWEIQAEAADGKDRLIDLIARIREKVIQGEDRLRWVGSLMQRSHWEQFCLCPDGEVIREAKRRCRWRLEGGGRAYELQTKRQIEEDLRANPPVIPEERIRRRAHKRWLNRGDEPGSAEDDWITAERELRELYILTYLTHGLRT
ncbi:MAG: DUF2934 domain-containing protein [Gemmataceae bacterium]|nr:DUF2934 domain-containing protein [Gemmataceae bacterium]